MTQPATPRSHFRLWWGLIGLVAGATGVGVSVLVSGVLGMRVNPVVLVAEGVIRITPGPLAEWFIQLVGTADKPILVGVTSVVLAGLFWFAGVRARRSVWVPQLVFIALAGVGMAAALTAPNSKLTDTIPILVGAVVWLILLPLLVAPLREGDEADEEDAEEISEVASEESPLLSAGRRAVLQRSGVAVLVAALAGFGGHFFGRTRRQVEQSRALLRLPMTGGSVPAGAAVDVPGVAPWRSSNADFYRIDTAIAPPAIDPVDWQLRIHGLVDRELVLNYNDLASRAMTEAWITICCVSNPIGGDLIGNAWWSGIRIADLLAEAGVAADADAVLQTSEDGWTCGTPLAALTDDRNALLALGMNGEPLPIDHGFPVRMVVPGLYGYVSATKWLVDLEVTRFADFTAYWTERGWSAQGPVKLASRIDTPGSGDEVAAGELKVGGSAWMQGTGVRAVEISLDGSAWTETALARVPAGAKDTWVQWASQVNVAPGDHELRVRAISTRDEEQTGAIRDVVPDGATGWHTVEFTAS